MNAPTPTLTPPALEPMEPPALEEASDKRAVNPFAAALNAARAGARRGMTIIEIMVVMGIIAIIGTAIAFGAIELFGGSQEDAAKIQLSTIKKGLDSYYVKHREYPDRLEVLVEKGILENEDQLSDPWKKKISYNVTGARSYELCSSGEDLSMGSADDVCAGRKSRDR